MERWKKITYMTAVYMFLTELRPIEPYMSAYLTGPNVNVSLFEVAYVVEAIRSYSALIVAILMLVTADILLYKPNLIFLTIWSCFSYLILTGSPSVTQIRVSTVGIGAMFSSGVLAYSYLYAQIEDVNQFQMATGIVTAAVQLGRVAGDLSAQLIITVTGGSYALLSYVTVGTMFLAIIWVSLFPKVKRKDFLLKTTITQDEKSPLLCGKSMENTVKSCEKKFCKNEQYKQDGIITTALRGEWANFKTSYSDPVVLKYCLWYIIGMAGYVEVLCNMNVLYSYVVQRSASDQNVRSNGLAEAIVTLSGAAGAYLMGRAPVDWTRHGDLFTAIGSTVIGALILSCYFHSQLYLVYLSNVLYGFVIQAQFVMVFTEIAKHLTKQCYFLVLEFNYIASVTLVNIVTLTLIQFNFMGITIPGRFLFFGSSFVVLGVTFLFNSVFGIGKKKTLY